MRINLTYLSSMLAMAIIVSVPVATLSFGNIGINLTPTNILFILFVIFTVMLFFIKEKVKVVTADYLLVVFLILASISTLFSLSSSPFGHVNTLMSAVGLYWVGRMAITKNGDIYLVENVLFYSAVISSLVAVSHQFNLIPVMEFERESVGARDLGAIEFNQGWTGLIYGSGNYGIWLEVGLMIALRWIAEGRKVLISYIGCVVLIYAIIISLSRSSWLALLLMLFIWFLIADLSKTKEIRKRASKGVLLFSLFFLIGMVGIFLFSDALVAAYDSVERMKSESIDIRFDGYSDAVNVMLNQPLLGNGPNMVEYISSHHTVHNIFLAAGASYGVIAFSLLLTFFVVIYKLVFTTYWAIPERVVGVRMGLWLATLAGIFIEILFFNGLVSKPLWVITGLVVSELNHYNSNHFKSIKAKLA